MLHPMHDAFRPKAKRDMRNTLLGGLLLIPGGGRCLRSTASSRGGLRLVLRVFGDGTMDSWAPNETTLTPPSGAPSNVPEIKNSCGDTYRHSPN
jgi:hypothetical protein